MNKAIAVIVICIVAAFVVYVFLPHSASNGAKTSPTSTTIPIIAQINAVQPPPTQSANTNNASAQPFLEHLRNNSGSSVENFTATYNVVQGERFLYGDSYTTSSNATYEKQGSRSRTYVLDTKEVLTGTLFTNATGNVIAYGNLTYARLPDSNKTSLRADFSRFGNLGYITNSGSHIYPNVGYNFSASSVNSSLGSITQGWFELGPSVSAAHNVSLFYQSSYLLANGTYYTCAGIQNSNTSACVNGVDGFQPITPTPFGYLGVLDMQSIGDLQMYNTAYGGRPCTLISGEINYSFHNGSDSISTTGNLSACMLEPYGIAARTDSYVLTSTSYTPDADYPNSTLQIPEETYFYNVTLVNISNTTSSAFINLPPNAPAPTAGGT